jgi:hydrogenase-4 component E
VQAAAGVRREVEPFVGYGASIAVVLLCLVVSLRLATRLPTPPGGSAFVVAVGMSTLLSGVFVIVSRRLALNQVLGYLVMDNGIYILGVAMVEGIPLVVELGVLMDAFLAVFVMSIATWHISREFDHMDVDQLNRLKG